MKRMVNPLQEGLAIFFLVSEICPNRRSLFIASMHRFWLGKDGGDRSSPVRGVVVGFVITFAAAWLAMFIVYGMNKKLSVLENTFVYLVVLILGINIAWIVASELKLTTITKDAVLYAGFILYRSVLTPLIYVILMNVMFRARTVALRLLYAGGALILMLALESLMMAYEIIRYVQWSLWHEAIEAALLIAVTYWLLRLYRKVA